MSVNNGKDRRVGVLDVFVIILILLCVAGLIVRIAVGRDGVLPEGAPESGEWALSFEISSVRAGVGDGFSVGEVMYTENGEVFGTVSGQVSVTPAKIYSEDEEGRYILSYASSDGGDNSMVDIKGTLTSEGYAVDYGFLVGGKIFASPGSELTLHTEKATCSVKILDIVKISG